MRNLIRVIVRIVSKSFSVSVSCTTFIEKTLSAETKLKDHVLSENMTLNFELIFTGQ